MWPHRLAWPRTSAFHAENTGSNPVEVTILFFHWIFLPMAISHGVVKT